MPVHQQFQDHNCLFIHIPKNAGLAVSRSLFGYDTQHRSIRQYRLIFGNRFVDKAFKFAFLRNPIDRFISAYYFLRNGGINQSDQQFCSRWNMDKLSLDDFTTLFLETPEIHRSMHFLPQHEWIMECGRNAMNYVGRFENIEKDFSKISKILKIGTKLLKLNQSSKSEKDIFTDSQLKLLRDFFRTEFNLFNTYEKQPYS